MKRKGNLSDDIETMSNFLEAFYGFTRGKLKRRSVKVFSENLMDNLTLLLNAYINGNWNPPASIQEDIVERDKIRHITKFPIEEHIIEWAILNIIEPVLINTFIRRTCSCVKKRGQHDFVDILRKDLKDDVEGTWYFVQLDIHHFFLNIISYLLMDKLQHKIKDKKLLQFILTVITAYHQGLVLGTKLSQILANYFLSDFDRDTMNLYGISEDPDKMAYWRKRYVNDCIITCRTEAQAKELSKGVQYLGMKFDRFVAEKKIYYQRFADNIIMKHSDKAFLHIITEMSIMKLSRDYYLQVNNDWNVRPVYAGGIDVCGYVSFHTHRLLRKRNKQSLCRQVAELKKKGLDPEAVRLQSASRIGYAVHANGNNLLRKLDINMEKRLGNVVRQRRHTIPFQGMRYEQKKSIEEIICRDNDDENSKFILLIDYKVDDSVFDKNDEDEPTKKRIAIRYRMIDSIENPDSEDPIYHWKSEEYYSYSGSAIMIDQLENDLSRDDFPLATVIREQVNKYKKKFYKFT